MLLLLNIILSLSITPLSSHTGFKFHKADYSSLLSIETIVGINKAARGFVGFSRHGRIIDAWYFPGKSNLNAIVIGGMHGSELSSIEVAKQLILQLQEHQPYYNVIVIPSLFPDNAEVAKTDSADADNLSNTGRYTHRHAADPNRQMPPLGKAFRKELPFDHMGRVIELENQLLLELIGSFKPHRIASIHAIRNTERAGIYADPRADSKGFALGFESDSSLAVEMAMHISEGGGNAPGNQLGQSPTALYYKDPPVASPGHLQKRSTCGSALANNRGHGISLGGWATTAIEDRSYQTGNRHAIRVLTIEFPGYKTPLQYADEKLRQQCAIQINQYASAIGKIFLGNHHVEKVNVNEVTKIANSRQ
ncbi:MAG TPA: hypothetical protein VGD17_14755 [Chitinophagaceae bacterium]